MPKTLKVESQITNTGVSLKINHKDYAISYPEEVWKHTNQNLKLFFQQHITLADTHFLPLMLNYSLINYDIPVPFFEPFLFKNQLYDMLYCESVDNAKHLEYLRKFYNLQYQYKSDTSQLPYNIDAKNFKQHKEIAVIPFSFGKESVATLGICLELGIEPILIYVQEPSQPYEEKVKRQLLTDLAKEFNIKTHYLKHEPGLFRYGKAFNLIKQSELGWGTEATTFLLLMLPFIFYYGASLVLFGNEYSNNETYLKNDWQVYSSYDQHPEWVFQQNNLLASLTSGKTQVRSMLEPLEESSVFYLLHHRYPKLAKYQFSCHARKPLLNKSNWCHSCSKCWFNNALALSFGIDPAGLGFQENFIHDLSFFNKQIMSRIAKDPELQFLYLALQKRGIFSGHDKIKSPHQWSWYKNRYSILKDAIHLPENYIDRLKTIFIDELKSMKKSLP